MENCCFWEMTIDAGEERIEQMKLHPRSNYVLCEKIDNPQTKDFVVQLITPSTHVKPGIFFAKVIAAGPETMYASVGDTIIMPTTMEPVRAKFVLARESEILAICDNDASREL